MKQYMVMRPVKSIDETIKDQQELIEKIASRYPVMPCMVKMYDEYCFSNVD